MFPGNRKNWRREDPGISAKIDKIEIKISNTHDRNGAYLSDGSLTIQAMAKIAECTEFISSDLRIARCE
jgi:hypothetical protein